MSAPLATALLAALTAGGCIFTSGLPRDAAALVLLLLLPGQALRRLLAVAPKADGVTRLVVDVSLSLATVVLAGLVLDRFSPGLQRRSLAETLAGVAMVASMAQMLFSRRLPWEDGTTGRRSRLSVRRALSVVGVCVAFGVPAGAGVLFVVHAARDADAKIRTTALSVTTKGSIATVGVTNDQGTDAAYKLRIMSEGTQILATAVRLSDKQNWQRSVSLSGVPAGRRVNIYLSLVGKPGIYRTVWAVSS